MYVLYRLPRTVGAHVSLLVPHLGCKAYPIRSGIVNAIGHLIARGFEAPEEDTNAPGIASCFPGCEVIDEMMDQRFAMLLVCCCSMLACKPHAVRNAMPLQ